MPSRAVAENTIPTIVIRERAGKQIEILFKTN